jgi:hypothetical protein
MIALEHGKLTDAAGMAGVKKRMAQAWTATTLRLARVPGLWLLAAVLLALVLVNANVPVSSAASETTKTLRTSLQTVLISALVGVFVFTLQSSSTRRQNRHDVLRPAYLMLLRGAERLADLEREEAMPQVDFGERANAFAAEARQLHEEAAATLMLEVGPGDPALEAWAAVDQAYWDCVKVRTRENTTIQAIQEQRRQLRRAIDRLGAVCHDRLASPR